jgi:hypothetical protein
MNYYSHPENPQITKAFELVKKGQRDRAVKVVAVEGYADAERQVQLIEGFLLHMAHNPVKQDNQSSSRKRSKHSFRRQKP